MRAIVQVAKTTLFAVAATALTGAAGWAGSPGATPQAAQRSKIHAEELAARRVSRSVKPVFKIVKRVPGIDARRLTTPDLVPLPPRVGTYVVGKVQLVGYNDVDAWEIYWRVKNQGTKATSTNALMRAECVPMNLNPAWSESVRNTLTAVLCQWLTTGETISPPVQPGQVVEKLSYITYPTDVPCAGPHPRVTVRVDTTNSVPEGLGEHNNELTIDLCQ